MATLEERQRWRARFLEGLYERSEANTLADVDMREIGAEIGLTDGVELNAVVRYLVDAGLVEFQTMGGGVSITFDGIRAVEDARSDDEAAQPGRESMALYLTSAEVREVEALVHRLSNALESGELEVQGEDRVELEVDLQTVELQLRTPRKSRFIMRAVFASISRILEGAAGGAVVIAVQELLKKL